ncbi:MAG: hypothetical protein HMLKMBBP_02677 [Planctomycetes bacterium]|nr:hypothetical protein [Planctomycetota bacterium]
MTDSIRLPKPLLAEVDRRARRRRVSRKAWIIDVLRREVGAGSAWLPGFFETFARPDAGVSRDVERMLATIRSARRSKPSPAL